VLVPPNFDPSPDFREARATATALRSALDAARPSRVVYLSTIGAQATQSNLLTQHSMIEHALRELSIPISFLRPGWFMENSSWDVAPAARNGVIASSPYSNLPTFRACFDSRHPLRIAPDSLKKIPESNG
jgi:uncharacterized protein YbjT (DUF2867 family)